ncbi:MAG: RNA 2',3'-cyclic phosphodiesterase [Sulfolobales archaeon]
MARLFIAVEIEDRSVLSRIIEVRNQIMGLGIDAKPVEDDNIHLTLRFLGDVEENLIPSIERAMEPLASIPPFRMRVRGLGVFPDLRSPRVVWVGVGEGSEILRSMRGILDRGLRGLRIYEDEHGFSPHITIARIRSRVNVDRLSRFVEENMDLDLGFSSVTRVVLKRSTLTPRGPIYSDVRRVLLGSKGGGLEGSGGGIE